MYPKKFFETHQIVSDPRFVFVLMPFAARYEEVYETIKETLEGEEINLTCQRADEINEPHIIETILQYIGRAGFVIVDLTGRNANVFYELGICHLVKEARQVILIAQDAADIPFDIQQYKTILYSQTIQGAKALSAKLKKTISDLLGEQIFVELELERPQTIGRKLMGKSDRWLYELEATVNFMEQDFCKMEVKYQICKGDGSKKAAGSDWFGLALRHEPGLFRPVNYEITYLSKISEHTGRFVITPVRNE